MLSCSVMRTICLQGYMPVQLSSMLTWMEYKGEWCNDKPCGYGIIKRYRGDGTSKIIYEGEWTNGEPANDP